MTLPFGTQPDPRKFDSLQSAALDQSIADILDITARAVTMNIGLAAYPVADIERLMTSLGHKPSPIEAIP